MTLIACLHPKNLRVLLADCLITSPGSQADDLTMPTRVYISPERRREMTLKLEGFRRKVIEIGPDLVALLQGRAGLAQTFARRARDWFNKQRPTEDEVRLFLGECCHDLADGLSVILVSALTPVYFMVGSVVHASAPFAGEYAVAGLGKAILPAW